LATAFGEDFDLSGFVCISSHRGVMAVCNENVKKRKARRIKNDRLLAAKKAAKAKA
jgi:hypothetical protein